MTEQHYPVQLCFRYGVAPEGQAEPASRSQDLVFVCFVEMAKLGQASSLLSRKFNGKLVCKHGQYLSYEKQGGALRLLQILDNVAYVISSCHRCMPV